MNTMNSKRIVLLAVGLALCGGATAQAQWIGATTGSSSTYTTGSNWTGGNVNNDFTGVTLTGTLTLLMPAFSPTTNLKFDYSGNHPMRLQGDGGVRTIDLGSGKDVSFQPDGTGRILTAGLMLGSTNRLVHFTTSNSSTFTIGAGNTWTQNGQLMGGKYVKRGDGTFDFKRGTGNTWTEFEVQQGTLVFSGTSVAPVAGRTVTVGSSGTFQVSGPQVNSYVVNVDGGVVDVLAGNITMSSVTSTGGGKIDNVGGTLTITNATVQSGKLEIRGAATISNPIVVNTGGGKGNLAYNSSTALGVAPTLNGNGGSNLAALSGTGTINAALTLDNTGDLLAPGNSTGILPFGTSQTWNSYTYEWEVKNWTGTTAGTDFDQLTIAGSLNLTGTTGSYVLDIRSLTALDVPGNAENFNGDTDLTWDILTTTTGITGFNAAHWSFNTGGFTNANTTGKWGIVQTGNNLQLKYFGVPEPSTVLLGGIGLAVTGWVVRRRRRIARG